MISYTMNDRIHPADLSCVQMDGYPAAKAQAFFDCRILSPEGRSAVFREAEQAFVDRIDDVTGVGYWRGEFWGKLTLSAVRVCRYTGDESLKAFLRESAHRVMSTQDPDGYIGTYKNVDFIQSPDVNVTEKLVGWKCNWCWNVWCRKYTLWALLECYELLEDPSILAACRRLADHLLSQLQRLGLELRDTGTFNGLPSGSLIKPLLVLYRHTGEEKYLNLCVKTAENWDRADGAIPNLIANARSGRPVHEWYPHSELWAKTYEMLSCLDGLLELYRVTGVKKYLDCVLQMQKTLSENELNTLFSVGYNDIFAHASAYQNAITEPCDVIHWMRVNYELFKLTGEEKYMNFFELAYLNAFLAGSFRDGAWGARCVRTSGRQMVAYQCGLELNHCCVDNMPRGFMNAAEAAVMTFDKGLYINLFTGCRARVTLPDGSAARVQITGDYARESAAEISIESNSAAVFTVRLRIPGWSAHNRVACAGKEYAPAAGGWLELPLTPGLNQISARFDAAPRLVQFPHAVEPLPKEDWHVRRWCNHVPDPFGELGAVPAQYMSWEKRCTLMKGPLLLAKSKEVGESSQSMFAQPPVSPDASVALTPVESDAVWTAWQAVFTADGRTQTAALCDYASAADRILSDPAYFTVWM